MVRDVVRLSFFRRMPPGMCITPMKHDVMCDVLVEIKKATATSHSHLMFTPSLECGHMTGKTSRLNAVFLILAWAAPTRAFTSQPRCLMSHNPPLEHLANIHLGPNTLSARRRRDDYFDEDWDDNDSYDFADEDFERRPRRRRLRRDDLGDFDEDDGLDLPSSYGRRDGWRLPDSVSKAILAGVFVLGIGLGVTVDSQVNTNPKDLASRDAIDNAAPNPTLCAKLGASAMAFDQRVFVSFNPFNVYVAQADVKPACVLRESNIVPVLKSRGLIDDNDVRSCKQNMNTWAFVGSLNDTPQLSCVYKSQDAQNEFLSDPKLGIGEDYLDKKRVATGKLVKDGMTEAQRELIRKQASMVPGVD